MEPEAKRQRHEAQPSGSNQTFNNMKNMKIALIGKTGCGKSATGNTILGRKEFKSESSSTSITESCRKAQSKSDGRCVAVVDTPGLFDSTLSNDEVADEMKKSIYLLAPGPHVFLLVTQIGRFTPEEKQTVGYIKRAFGKGAEKYIMFLFTRGDDLEEEEKSIEDYLHKSDPALKKLIADCGNRFHVFNNREKRDRTQVIELLEKIDDMVTVNGGSHYTNEMLQEAEAAIQKETEKNMKEKDEEIRKEREEMEKKYQQQIEEMKQQGEGMKKFIVELQNQQARQMESMMERFEEQARRQAEMMTMRAQAEESRREAEEYRRQAPRDWGRTRRPPNLFRIVRDFLDPTELFED